ncbi:MAG: L-threonylcarbamoyladenylate synthase [Woeseiaceae bacterium]|nr:L-threonylcarbamoyladenylate synthase [Woeseiaceae bacterium]
MKAAIRQAADALLAGGVIAYPTEGVFGLGCLADNVAAIERILRIKRRDPSKGLILIASRRDQLEGWVVADDLEQIPEPDPAQPTTWIVRPGEAVPELVRGEHPGVAVRLTGNPTARAICETVDMPITSTSANFSGRPVARNGLVLRRQFGALVDYIVPGACGPARGPSAIKVLGSEQTIRSSSE